MKLNFTILLISLTLLVPSHSFADRIPQANNSTPKPWLHHGKLKISKNGHYFIHEDETPFFLLADTGWALFNRLTKEQAKVYFKNRSEKKFNTIQAFLTAQWMPKNIYNEPPFIDDNPLQLNTNYINHVNDVIEYAADENLYILLSIGEVFRPDAKSWYLSNEINAYKFGKILANKIGHHPNLIWSLGQDFNPKRFSKTNIDVRGLIQTAAKGITFELNKMNQSFGSMNHYALLMSFHPNGLSSSSKWFHNESWLDFNMIQTGHSKPFNQFTIEKIQYDYYKRPVKPVIESESPYEDILSYRGIQNGTKFRFSAYDIRVTAYWSVFSGAAGFVYGHNNIWQFWDNGPFEGTEYWENSLNSIGANQMRHLIELLQMRPIHKCIPDQSLLAGYSEQNTKFKQVSIRAEDESYAMIYTPIGETFSVNTNKISPKAVETWWFNPRNGEVILNGIIPGSDSYIFNPPKPTIKIKNGKENDWILILDNLDSHQAKRN